MNAKILVYMYLILLSSFVNYLLNLIIKSTPELKEFCLATTAHGFQYMVIMRRSYTCTYMHSTYLSSESGWPDDFVKKIAQPIFYHKWNFQFFCDFGNFWQLLQIFGKALQNSARLAGWPDEFVKNRPKCSQPLLFDKANTFLLRVKKLPPQLGYSCIKKNWPN
jgi:hypothetical protein